MFENDLMLWFLNSKVSKKAFKKWLKSQKRLLV